MTDAQPNLLDWQPQPTDRFGARFSHAFDYERLNGQQALVFKAMKSGRWLTLREIADETGQPEASISARIRDLKNIHGLQYDRKRRPREAAQLKNRGVVAGVPDLLVLRHNGHADFLELKTTDGRLSDEQFEIHKSLTAKGLHRVPNIAKPWLSWEIDLMNRFYREKGPAALAGKLGRTIDSVKGKARYLGLAE
jgi:hypothetical protein